MTTRRKNMKKRLIAIIAVLAMLVSSFAFGCGKKGNGGGNDDDDFNAIQQQPLTLEGFNADYYPVADKIQQRSGVIDVVIQFDGTEIAWQALATEYERLHSSAVTVNVGVEGVQNNYKDRLNQELNGSNTTWDIVQGNFVNDISSKCVNMSGAISKKNAYAGNASWRSVLTTNAYQTDTTGASSSVYIINSQNLQTAWFINTVAFDEAQNEATKDGVTLKQNPQTWDELMSVCEYMVKAGYKFPLGLSLDTDSIDAYQFSWLLRVYGDYYYRNEYNNIMTDASYRVDVTAENPEGDINYGYQPTKLYNVILDETSEYYCGAKSAKYKEFVSQLGKVRPYIHENASQQSLEQVRGYFRTQSIGKESPQIILDYAGSGLAFDDAQGFKMDFFDYPYMVSEGGYIDEGTLLRDVGGNGGYLSIVNHGSRQNELNLDFIKFVMSPYGQTIFYNALSKTDIAPQGITTVKNDLVTIPAKWSEFFGTTKISFTGLSDTNEFVRNFIRYLGGIQESKDKCVVIWKDILKKSGNISVDSFTSQWNDTLLSAWKIYANQQHWNVDCYKTWGGPTQ